MSAPTFSWTVASTLRVASLTAVSTRSCSIGTSSRRLPKRAAGSRIADERLQSVIDLAADFYWEQDAHYRFTVYRPSGEPWIGPDAVLHELFMRLGTEWDGFAVTPKSYHDAGSSVVVEGRYAGTYTATGKSMDAQFCHVWEVEGGKVTRFQQYLDTAKLKDVMQVG